VTKAILTMKGISKEFPGVKALDQVDLELYPGEVHALMGENGAGKSTLMKILSGVYQATEGDMRLFDQDQSFKSPLEAQVAGISMIHQEFNLFPNLSVGENIFASRLKEFSKWGRIQWKRIYEESDRLIQSIGSEIDVKQEVQHLTVQNQQVVEIVKALSNQCKILIMDEPSAALPENEVQKMFKVVRQLKEQGVSIVYVSHRMKEVFEIADRITVLRDGRKIKTLLANETSQTELIRLMVGKEVGDLYPGAALKESKKIMLEADQLQLANDKAVSFKLYEGEILGLFGLMGSGTHTLAERLFGLRKGEGRINVAGQDSTIFSPAEAMELGVGFVPPDRHRQGLVKELPIDRNVPMAIYKNLVKKWFLRPIDEKNVTETYIQRLNIKTPGTEQLVELLSGGNQQKVVLAKWLATEPKILIMEEPTRGVDIGAKAEIYRLIQQLASEGLSILLISSEMPEVIGMCDRILVMHKGDIVEEFVRGEVSQENLLKAASNPIGKRVV
jgi:ABC-type sugar transport system ATPase subunit